MDSGNFEYKQNKEDKEDLELKGNTNQEEKIIEQAPQEILIDNIKNLPPKENSIQKLQDKETLLNNKPGSLKRLSEKSKNANNSNNSNSKAKLKKEYSNMQSLKKEFNNKDNLNVNSNSNSKLGKEFPNKYSLIADENNTQVMGNIESTETIITKNKDKVRGIWNIKFNNPTINNPLYLKTENYDVGESFSFKIILQREKFKLQKYDSNYNQSLILFVKINKINDLLEDQSNISTIVCKFKTKKTKLHKVEFSKEDKFKKMYYGFRKFYVIDKNPDEIVEFQIYFKVCKEYKEIEIKNFKGLHNFGSTCYFNSLIQSLYMIGEFQKIILECPINNFKQSIIKYLKKIFFYLKEENPKYSKLKTQKVLLNLGFDSRQFHQQQDAMEFITRLFDKIESETKNLTNFDILSVFKGKYSTKISSTISDYRNERIEEFLFLTLPMDGAKNVHEAFANLTKEEDLIGENQLYNENSKSKEDATKQLSFVELPEVLILQLARFKYKEDDFEKIYDEFQFEKEISILISKDSINIPYTLFSVIVHRGCFKFGHYYCYIFNNEKWIKFDDTNISFAREFEALFKNYGGLKPQVKHIKDGVFNIEQVQRKNCAYILFYIQTPKFDKLTIFPNNPEILKENFLKAKEENNEVYKILNMIEEGCKITIFSKDTLLKNAKNGKYSLSNLKEEISIPFCSITFIINSKNGSYEELYNFLCYSFNSDYLDIFFLEDDINSEIISPYHIHRSEQIKLINSKIKEKIGFKLLIVSNKNSPWIFNNNKKLKDNNTISEFIKNNVTSANTKNIWFSQSNWYPIIKPEDTFLKYNFFLDLKKFKEEKWKNYSSKNNINNENLNTKKILQLTLSVDNTHVTFEEILLKEEPYFESIMKAILNKSENQVKFIDENIDTINSNWVSLINKISNERQIEDNQKLKSIYFKILIDKTPEKYDFVIKLN